MLSIAPGRRRCRPSLSRPRFLSFAKPIRVANTQEGIDKIVLALCAKGVSKVVLEAIGSYGRKLIRRAHAFTPTPYSTASCLRLNH